MFYDVLTWVVHEGELYVLIIIIHGMLRNFVNMKFRLELDVECWITWFGICMHFNINVQIMHG